MSLQILYRPKTLKNFAGNEEVIASLSEIVKRKKPPAAFLLVGNSGCGKCITGDSLILTQNGIKPIVSFSQNEDGFTPLETNIFNGTNIETTSHFFEEKTDKTISIKNELGMELEGTYEHPILCLNNNRKFEFKQLQNIKEGDWTCVPRKPNIFNTSNYKINFIQEKNRRDSNSIPLINLPQEINTDIAKLLGYIIANGCQHSPTNTIAMSTKNREYQEDISNIISNWGQKIGKIYNNKDFTIGSMWLGKFMLYLLQEDKLPTARYKKIPPCILESTKEIQIAFLQKLIDCDSWWRENVLIEYCTASEVLAKQVQLLLLNLGVISILTNKYVKEYNHTYWGVKICGEQLDTYLDIVGSTKYKQSLTIKRNTNKDVIPFLSSFIEEKIQKIRRDLKVTKSGHFYYKQKFLRFKISRNNLSRKNITYPGLNQIHNDIKKLPQIISVLELKKACCFFLDSYYYFSKIKTVKRHTKEIKVYDFTMPESHSFLSNGYISHNTTLGRILATMLGAAPEDYTETNASNDRTLPAIRKIIDDMKYAPMVGKKKVILMDECFSAETLISTLQGQKQIDSVKIGDKIFNLNGIDEIEKIFINNVPLDRVVKINKSDGTCTFCSKEHEYHIDGEWVQAKDLTKKLLVCYSNDMLNNLSLERGQDELYNNMSFLQKSLYSNGQKAKILFEKLFHETSSLYKTNRKNNTKNLRILQSRIFSEKEKSDFLFPFLCRKTSSKNKQCQQSQSDYFTSKMRVLQNLIYSAETSKRAFLFSQMSRFMDSFTRINQKENVYTRTNKKCEKRFTKIQTNKKSKNFIPRIIRKDEKEQPFAQSQKHRKSQIYETIKQYFAYLEWKEGREWSIDRAPEVAYDGIGLGSRNSYFNSRSFTCWFTKRMVRQKESTYELQSGHRECQIENSNRSGCEKSQYQTNKKIGQEERITTKMERVESVEIYKRGDNDESFAGIIGDKERNQGYVTFYDLQIKTNHSYIANNNMVHNCHGVLGATQEALLKALEEPPAHVHFILCTTNPEALKDTFKRRCHVYEVSPLTSSQMMVHLRTIIKAEKVKDYPEDVLEHIIELSNGSPGIALKYLDMVIDITDKEEALKLLKSSGTSEKDVIEICRALINFKVNGKTRWLKVRSLLKNFSGDAESARRPILGYLNTCLLGSNTNDGESFALVMNEFTKNFYDSGKSGLTLACFLACKIDEE